MTTSSKRDHEYQDREYQDREYDLPPALREMLVAIRQQLKIAGDDGRADGHRARVRIQVGWREVRAVYQLYTKCAALERSRDEWMKKAKKASKHLETVNATYEETDLLNNRSVVALLIDVQRILSGKDQSPSLIQETKRRIDRVVTRARTKRR